MPFDLELEQAVAKMQKADKPMEKSEQYLALKKFANRQRQPQETEQQAFVKFITTDPYGKQLYRTYTQTKATPDFNMLPSGHNPGAGGDPKRQTGADDEDVESEGMKTLRSIADKIREKHPELGLSKSAAVTLAIQTPAGAAAYLADRKARTRVA
jgi:hypothetical protein